MADPLWSSVAILCHLDEVDGTTVNLGYLGGAPGLFDGVFAPSITTKKFGVAAVSNAVDTLGDGTNAGVATTSLALGTGDFTVEAWIQSDLVDATNFLIKLSDSNATDYADHTLAVHDDGSVTLVRDVFDTATDNPISSTTLISSSTGLFTSGVFSHVVLQRASGVMRVAIDGVSAGTGTSTRDLTEGFRCLWGGGLDFGVSFVDEIRLTAGTARYTTPFTPPTAAFDAFGTGGTTVEGDGSSAGAATSSIVGALRAAGVGASVGTSAPTADAVNKTPRGDGASIGAATAIAGIADATQTSGWSRLNFWPPLSAWDISTDNKTATLAPTAAYDEVRGVRAKSTGKWYFEVSTGGVSSKGVGITQTGVALGVGFPPVRQSSALVSTWGFAFDADTRDYWVRFDGSWNAGGPGVGAADGTLLPGTQVPYADQSASSGSGQTFVARFTEADLLSTPPAGFTAIDDIPGNVGAAAGTSTALGAGSLGAAGAASALGASTAAGTSTIGHAGLATAPGAATAQADGIPATARDGAAAGTSAAAGVARSTARAQASAAGTSAGVGRMLFEIVGISFGTSTATALAGGRTRFQSDWTALTRRAELTALPTAAVQTALIRPSNIAATTELAEAPSA